jgi:hypothetical protein
VSGFNRTIRHNARTFRVNNAGLVAASTPRGHIANRDFLVLGYSQHIRTGFSTSWPYNDVKLQDVVTGDLFVWRTSDILRNGHISATSASDFSIVNMGEPIKQIEKRVLENIFARRRASGTHILSLTEVERPTNPQIRFGATEVEEAGTRFSYTDNFINIIWIPTSTNFNFILTNNSPHSMRIIWDEAVYVDENGMMSNMIHQETRLIDRNNSQMPSTVLRGARISNLLAPVSKIHYSDGWAQRPLFNNADGEKLDNKTVRVSLPLQIENVTNEYVFTFTIKWEYTHPELQNMSVEEFLELQKK